VHGGYNFQTGVFVYGVETDISFGGAIDYLASVRGRFGVASDNWLFYGTAGLALAKTNFDISVSDGNVRHDYNLGDSQTGFVVGGGAEFKLSPKWSIGVEGLYYGFDGSSASRSFYDAGPYGPGGSGEGVAAFSKAEAGSDVGVIRARLNYHLNSGYERLK
jgi:outer membrane immunogenic protein